jgi:hypothetical protein
LKYLLRLIKNYFSPKIYTKKQRLIYGLGWFLISIIIGGVFAYIEWKILSYAFIIFGIMSLFAIKER